MWKIIVTIITLIIMMSASNVLLSYDSTQNNDFPDCRHIDTIIEYPECHLQEYNHALTCFGGIDEKWRIVEETIHLLALCNWPNATLNPQEILQGFSSLRALKISNSNLTNLTSSFPVECQFLEVGDKKIGL